MLAAPALGLFQAQRTPAASSRDAGNFRQSGIAGSCLQSCLLVTAPAAVRLAGILRTRRYRRVVVRCAPAATSEVSSPTRRRRLSTQNNEQVAALWGGGGVQVGRNGASRRKDWTLIKKEKAKLRKWTPTTEHWEAFITDDEGEEFFGKLRPGDEVEVLAKKRTSRDLEAQLIRSVGPLADSTKQKIDEEKLDPELAAKGLKWVNAMVTSVQGGKADVVPAEGKEMSVPMGKGWFRRREDCRDLIPAEEIRFINECRAKENSEVIFQYGLTLESIAARSYALVTLSKLRAFDFADKMIEALGAEKFSSTSLRAHAHEYAHAGNLQAGMAQTAHLDEVPAVVLMIEVMALGLSSVIVAERNAYVQNGGGIALFFEEIDENTRVIEALEQVQATLPTLQIYRDNLVKQISRNERLRNGITEAFNELLMSCGRAGAAALGFRIVEWIEALRIPKTDKTYEALGMNVAKRVSLTKRVWDLPMCPEDEVCPEVVFAGRSNVGKSSLVNMLVGRKTLAPTSSKPGKTKTMDFFNVNNGHRALPFFRLVDVPGLGFARVSNELRERWVGLIGGYFVKRKSLKIVFHLLDASLCEFMPADRELWRLLAQAQRDPKDFELCIALTKADDTDAGTIARFADIIREALRKEGSELAMNASIFACSSMSKLGKDTLWRKIWSAVGGQAKMDIELGEGPEGVKRRKEEFGSAAEVEHRETKGYQSSQDLIKSLDLD